MRKDFPTNNQLCDAVLVALEKLGGEAKTADIDEKVIEVLQLPPEVVELEDESGICTKLNYCLRWCRTKLKGEFIESPKKGTWRLIKK